MTVNLYKEPEMENPVLVCGWPGIGRVGILAVDYLRRAVAAEEIGEVDPLDFFEPRNVIIRDGLLKSLEFPTSKFYYRKSGKTDLLIFIGEEQPAAEGAGIYAAGQKAYQLANLVLDVAKKFGCQRVYTSGAAVTQTHHTLRPRVWAVPNGEDLIDAVRKYENTVLMSEIEGRHGQGAISGLNGLMLGAAWKRGFQGLCLMGEIPYYLQASPWPYPRASIAVLKVLTGILGIEIDIVPLQEMANRIDENIETFLKDLLETETVPQQVRDQFRESIEKMKTIRESPGPVTEEDQKWIMENIDDLFKGGEKRNERAS